MRRRSLLVPLVLVTCTVGGALQASAGPRVPTRATTGFRGSDRVVAVPVGPGFSIARNDGNDVAGALDLRSMKITRGKSKDTIVLSTFDGVSNSDIDPDNGNFAVLIDTNDNRKYDFAQYVFFQAGKLRGVLVKLSTGGVVDRTAPVSRATPKAFRTVIQRGRINSPGTYRFGVFGYNQAAPCSKGNPCTDSIPNRFPLIPLDHRAPEVSVEDMSPFATDVSDGLTSPLDFTIDDDEFGTGLKRWSLQRKEIGAGTGWETVKDGIGRDVHVNVPGAEGATYDIRVVALDKQNNKEISRVQRTTFAFDDQNSSVVGYLGTAVASARSGAFQDTITTLDQNASATFSFDADAGSEVCLVAGRTAVFAAGASASLDGAPAAAVIDLEGPSTPDRFRIHCVTVGLDGAHTLVIRSTDTNGYVIDGFAVMP